MEDPVYFYSVIHHRCSCRQENGELTNLGKHFKTYVTSLEQGSKGVDVLNGLGIRRMCCRSRFLSIPLLPMIDRSKDRVYDEIKRNVTRINTVEIKAKNRLGLPTTVNPQIVVNSVTDVELPDDI